MKNMNIIIITPTINSKTLQKYFCISVIEDKVLSIPSKEISKHTISDTIEDIY